MHLGSKNPEFEYTMITENNERIELKSSRVEGDLGVYMSRDMKWANHIEKVVSKANRSLGVIRNSFKNLDPMTFKLLYCALVTPDLDYAVSVWNPYFQKDIDLIESVQRRATKIVREIKNLEYSERLKRLDLTTLEQRRKRGYLIQIYKMINGLEKIELVNGINFA